MAQQLTHTISPKRPEDGFVDIKLIFPEPVSLEFARE
jgi:hypothetical protein